MTRFVVMLVSSLVLWWPKNRAARKQRFAVKWDASRSKRLNYDLHSALGFYLALVGRVIALSGLFWAFKWVGLSQNNDKCRSCSAFLFRNKSGRKPVSYLATGRTEAVKPTPKPLLPTTAPAASPIDVAFADAWQRVPLARSLSIGTGKPDQPLRLRVGMGEQLYRANLLMPKLPITGFYIWWGRLKKNKEKHVLPQLAAK